MRRIARYLRLPRTASRIRADVDDELRFELEMRARDLQTRGLSPAAAREQALAEFGDLEATRRYCEDLDMDSEAHLRRAHLVDDLRSDLAIAWRGMRRTPTFAAVVLTTLTLGIAANTMVFSVVRRVLIAPLPYQAPDHLYRLYTQASAVDGDDDKLSLVELANIPAQSRSVAAVIVSGNYGNATYTDGRVAEPWRNAFVSLDFLDVLGVRPALGRNFIAADVATGAPRGVMIGYDTWRRTFGGDPRVIGRRVTLDNAAHTIVGVLPAGFIMPEPRSPQIDALRPVDISGILSDAPSMSRSRAWHALARLRDGATLDALEVELPVLRRRIQAEFPEIRNAGIARALPLHDAMVGSAGTVLRLVMASALFVLVIACVNIAGLFLSRAVSRRRELGLRAALGASRGRLVRQMLTECLAYGAVGGALGVGSAVALKRAFMAMAGTAIPQLGDVRMDGGVLGFAAAVSIACGIAFGVAPALAATRLDFRAALGDAPGHGASQGRTGVRGTRALVSAQIALAIVLLVGAGLLVRTFMTLMGTDVGYTADARTLTFYADLPAPRSGGAAGRHALVNEFVQRVHALPGVTAVGYTAAAPWTGGLWDVRLRVQGRAPDASSPLMQSSMGSSEFFKTLGIPLRSGRVFTPDDRVVTSSVLVISESVARRYWPNANPIGARVQLLEDRPARDSVPWMEVVGVVADVRPSVGADPVGTVYASADRWIAFLDLQFIVRTTGSGAALIPGITRALHDIAPTVPLLYPRTVRDVLRESVARQRLAMVLVGAFAALALALAALGIYSVMAYSVVARTREFGIRSALGAGRSTILVLVLRQGVATTAAGVVVGVALAATLSKYASSLLVGVSAHDALTFTVAPAIAAGAAMAACLIPARAATRVEPVEALRME
jgi:predicted permease